MKRRSFLATILAAAAAPAIVRADSLMRIVPRDTTVLLPFSGRSDSGRYYVRPGDDETRLVRDGLSWATAFKSMDEVPSRDETITIYVSNQHWHWDTDGRHRDMFRC